MKILIIQEKGRHEKNWMFRESLNIQRALTKLGYESTVWGLNYDTYKIPFEEIEKEHDVIFLIENYPVHSWLPDLSKSNKLKVFWSIDSHVALYDHIEMCKKNKIDIVLNAVYGHEKYFSDNKTFYFPNAYPDDLIKPLNIEKIYDVGFCGNINNRGSWMDEIKNKFNLKIDEFVIGSDMVESINKYKIHFNRNISDDLNYRTFETLGCKTFLLTNETPGLNELFDIGNHLVTYESVSDLFEKIDYYLNNESERMVISQNGYDHVVKNHTFYERMKYFINIINENI
jgi:spore maturation protein CgeB